MGLTLSVAIVCIVGDVEKMDINKERKMALSLLAKDGTKLSNKRKMLRNCINPENIISGLK